MVLAKEHRRVVDLFIFTSFYLLIYEEKASPSLFTKSELTFLAFGRSYLESLSAEHRSVTDAQPK
jgi:hypothetical protein